MKVYRAVLTGSYNATEGARIHVMLGDVSECGEWIENDNVRWRRTPEWKDTLEEAQAVVATQITELGTAMLRQATELQAAAMRRAVEV